MSGPRGRIAFLLSGSGSTLLNLFAAIDRGEVPGEVVVVLSDRPGVKGLAHAQARGVPTLVLDRRAHAGREAYGRALEAALAPHRASLVVLGGFLTLFAIPPSLAGRVLNVHPSLLPRHGGPGCWGLHVHRAVLAAGDRESGCSVHVVTDEVDGGPIVAQARVPVLAGDTPEALAARVQEAERGLYPPAIAAFLRGEAWVEQGRLHWRAGTRPA